MADTRLEARRACPQLRPPTGSSGSRQHLLHSDLEGHTAVREGPMSNGACGTSLTRLMRLQEDGPILAVKGAAASRFLPQL